MGGHVCWCLNLNDDNEYMQDDAIRCMRHDAGNADGHHASIAIVILKIALKQMKRRVNFLKKKSFFMSFLSNVHLKRFLSSYKI